MEEESDPMPTKAEMELSLRLLVPALKVARIHNVPESLIREAFERMRQAKLGSIEQSAGFFRNQLLHLSNEFTEVEFEA